jgi:DNA repair exonuclease SbcCD ATPase subunit
MQIEHQSELSKAEFEADKIVVKLKKEHEMKVKELSETTLQQLKASEKEVGPLEYKLKHLLALESNYLRKINSAKDKRKDALNKKLKRVQSQISEMKRALSNSKKQIDLIKKQKESKLKALKDEYDKLINTQLKRIESMKSSFAFEIQKRKAEMEALKKEVISLNDSIKALINRKKEEMQKLRNSTIPWSSTDILQINIPTYLVVYEADGKYRYEVFTPIDIQETEGLIESFQRKILGFKSRMKLFFKPRTKNLDIYISQTLTKRLSTDASFEKEVYEKCLNVNILYSPELIYLLTDGLEEFKGRKWVSAEEISEIKSSIGEK